MQTRQKRNDDFVASSFYLN